MRVSRNAWIAMVGGGVLAAAGGTALATGPAPINQVATPIVRGALQEPITSVVRVGDGLVVLHTQGALDVAMLQVTIPPGGGSDWHKFSGPHFAVVKSGTVTFVDAACTRHDVSAGSADYAPGTVTQKNVNLGTVPAVFYVTFLIPHGALKPPITQPAPAGCNA